MDTDSLVYHIKERFDKSGYDKEDTRPLPIEINKKVIGFMKDELGGKIMTEFVALRARLHACIKLDNQEDKKCKGI